MWTWPEKIAWAVASVMMMTASIALMLSPEALMRIVTMAGG